MCEYTAEDGVAKMKLVFSRVIIEKKLKLVVRAYTTSHNISDDSTKVTMRIKLLKWINLKKMKYVNITNNQNRSTVVIR